MYRSSRQEVFCKKRALRNFERFTGKHLCQSLFFNKVAGIEITTSDRWKPVGGNSKNPVNKILITKKKISV